MIGSDAPVMKCDQRIHRRQRAKMPAEPSALRASSQLRMRAVVTIRLLSIFTILSSVTAAQAGDGRCVWSHLPVSIQQRALAAGLDGGPSALSAELPPDQLAQSEEICGLTPKNAEALRKAESGYMLQVLAERWLADHAQLSAMRLEGAWINMDKETKERIENWAIALNHDPEAHDAAYRSFVLALGFSTHLPADAKPRLLTYIQGRALREVYERRF
jgi:hypothetical protein